MELRNNISGELEPCHFYTLILKMRNSDMCLHNAYIPLLSKTCPLVEASVVRQIRMIYFEEMCNSYTPPAIVVILLTLGSWETNFNLIPSELIIKTLSSVQFSYSVESHSLRPHGQQHTRPPCPWPTPGAEPKWCP